MSDLISRSEVNDVIDEFEVYTCGRPNTMKVEISVLQLQRFINKLKNIPTAYDIDEVSDDVCEWKYTKEIMDNAEFKVGCNTNALKRGVVPNNFSYHDFKYCPYCGKKILCKE